MPSLSWSRLERAYWSDDKVVALRLEHGYIGETFHTRFIGYGGPIRCPRSNQFEALAEALGFRESEVSTIEKVAQMSRDIGLCTVKMSRTNAVWDLKSRRSYAGPKSLQPGYEAEKKRRQRTQSESEPVPEVSRDVSPATNVRTYERTGQTKPLGRERPRDPIFEALVAAMGWALNEVTEQQRGPLNRAVRDLKAVGATPVEIEVRAARYRHQHADWTLTPPALAKWWADLASSECDCNSYTHFEWCPLYDPEADREAAEIAAVAERAVAEGA